MKKVALSLAVLFAAALVSCGNKENKTEEATVDSTMDTTMVAEPTTDSAANEVTVDSTATNVENADSTVAK